MGPTSALRTDENLSTCQVLLWPKNHKHINSLNLQAQLGKSTMLPEKAVVYAPGNTLWLVS